MSISSSSSARQCTVIILFSLAAHFATISAECTRNSTDKAAAPTFVCHVDAEVTQTSGCDTMVSETFELPHSDGSSFNRELQLLSKHQVVLSVRARVQNSVQLPMVEQSKNEVRIRVNMTKSLDPVSVVLTYILKDGAVHMGRKCAPEAPFDGNFMRWGFPERNQKVEALKVHFRSAYSEMKPVPGDYEARSVSPNDVEVSATSVTGNFKSLAELDSAVKCPAVFQCRLSLLDHVKNISPMAAIIYSVAALLQLLFLCICCCRVCGRRQHYVAI